MEHFEAMVFSGEQMDPGNTAKGCFARFVLKSDKFLFWSTKDQFGFC